MNSEAVRILLLDLDQMMRQGLGQLIATRPELTVVGEAANGRPAGELIRAAAPQVLLMDVHLPGGGGVDGARRLLTEFPGVRVVALSGDAELERVLQALHAGVSGYVVTEQGFDELIRAIHTVMQRQLYLSPEVSSAVIRHLMKTYRDRKPAVPGVGLSDRERWLLRLIAEGRRNKEIAGHMAVTVKSVETYRFRLMKKLGYASAAELIRYAIREGVVQA
jgi:DNA-binding NarL/FixJ family response regulator